MPLKLYCPNPSCSEPILYDLNKPIFCPFCGVQLNTSITQNTTKSKDIALAQTKIPIVKDKTPQITIVDRSDVGAEVIDDMIDETSFQVEIEKTGDKGITFANLAQQPKTGFSRPRPKKVNKKKEIELFRQEASKSARIEIQDTGID